MAETRLARAARKARDIDGVFADPSARWWSIAIKLSCMAARASDDAWMELATSERLDRIDAAARLVADPTDDRLVGDDWIELLIGDDIVDACETMLRQAGVAMQSPPDIMA